MTVLVTGGAGFIGSAVVRQYIDETPHDVVNVDALTYAADPAALDRVRNHPRHHFEHVNVCDGPALRDLLQRFQPDAVMHLAAESHVDRSIDAAAPFIQTNVVGTSVLLDEVLRYWRSLGSGARDRFRLHHVSTDEVYGSIPRNARAGEDAPFRPASPYSASKAASDHLVHAWHRTYGLPVVVTAGSNTYGPHQHAEKLIPHMIADALAGRPMPVYGTGQQLRDWIHVEDHARALRSVLDRGTVGQRYNIGSGVERRNIDVVRTICSLLDELHAGVRPYEGLIRFTADRPGHDHRYAMDTRRVRGELGWAPTVPFDDGLRTTVEWALQASAGGAAP